MSSLNAIAFDLDGVICKLKAPGQSYADIEPYPDASASLHRLKQNGAYIILHTARGQATYNNNDGQVLANMEYLFEWLRKWDIPYDEIRFKPNCIAFVDDRAVEHRNWQTTEQRLHTILKMWKSHE